MTFNSSASPFEREDTADSPGLGGNMAPRATTSTRRTP